MDKKCCFFEAKDQESSFPNRFLLSFIIITQPKRSHQTLGPNNQKKNKETSNINQPTPFQSV